MDQPKRIQVPEVTISSRIPRDVEEAQSRHPLLRRLWVSSAGYFPKAFGHITERAPEAVDFYLMMYCLAGKGWFEGGQTSWRVEPGDLVIARPGVAHGYGADEHDPWSIQFAHFDGSDVADLLRLANIRPDGAVISLGLARSLLTLFNDLLTTLQAGYSLHHLTVASACLRHILSQAAFINAYTPHSPADLNVQRVIDYMLSHLGQSVSLDELAEQAGQPRSSFVRRFREKTGYAPIDYFIRLKVQKACQLLETTELQVAEISHALGYSDPYYFSRLFKKFMRVSPTFYRAQPR
jgi:AraC-like DNA-binding protein